MFKDNIILKSILVRALNISRLIRISTVSTVAIDYAAQVPKVEKPVQLNTIDTFISALIQKNYNTREKLGHDIKKEYTDKVGSLKYSPSVNFVHCVGLLSKSFSTDFTSVKYYELNLNISTLDITQLDHLLESSMQEKCAKDFHYLIEKCIERNRLPCADVLLASLKYLSVMGKVELIESLGEICKKQKHSLLHKYADFAPFKALALWRRGDSYLTSLSTLYDGYIKNCHTNDGKCTIRSIFDIIINECLKKNSDAVLQSLIQIAYKLHKKHNDIFVLACLWKQSFSSDWFSDQQLAVKLIESSSDLRRLVVERSKQICNIFLDKHNLNAVHRLIEFFIKYEHKEACSNCLNLLFNYQYFRRDVRACTEIVKSFNNLNIELNTHQVKQYLDLILNKKCDTLALQHALHGNRKDSVNVNKIQYRF